MRRGRRAAGGHDGGVPLTCALFLADDPVGLGPEALVQAAVSGQYRAGVGVHVWATRIPPAPPTPEAPPPFLLSSFSFIFFFFYLSRALLWFTGQEA